MSRWLAPLTMATSHATGDHAMKKIIGFIADLFAPVAVAAALVEVGYVTELVLPRGAPAR